MSEGRTESPAAPAPLETTALPEREVCPDHKGPPDQTGLPACPGSAARTDLLGKTERPDHKERGVSSETFCPCQMRSLLTFSNLLSLWHPH